MVESLHHILDELIPSSLLSARAFAIARDLGHVAYDCFYLAAAELRGAQVVTADTRLIQKVAGTPLAGAVVSLGAWVPGVQG